MAEDLFKNIMDQQDAEQANSEQNALAALKQQADLLGVAYAPTIGAETLAKRIDDHIKAKEDALAGIEPQAESSSIDDLSKAIDAPAPEAPTAAPVAAPAPKKVRADVELTGTMGGGGGSVSARVDPNRKLTLREWKLRDSLRLVRVIVHNMDPNDKDLEGQIFTVANEYIGTVTKHVPFGEKCGTHGYHIPNCIYKQLKAAKMLQIRVTTKNGREEVESKWIRKFNIEVLPTITEHELNKLKASQLATQAID